MQHRMIPETSSQLGQESYPVLPRQHLRRSGSSSSALHKLGIAPTGTLLGRLLLLSSAIAAVMLCGALFTPIQ